MAYYRWALVDTWDEGGLWVVMGRYIDKSRAKAAKKQSLPHREKGHTFSVVPITNAKVKRYYQVINEARRRAGQPEIDREFG